MSEAIGERWTAERQAHQFYREHATRLSDRRRHYYERCLREWVEFICSEAGCSPEMVDYRRCTLLCIGDTKREIELHPDAVSRFLRSVPNGYIRTCFHSILHLFFKWLVTKGVLNQVPIPPPKSKPQRRKKQPLEINDILRFADALSQEPLLKRAPISLLLASGVRVSSLCSLSERSIELDRENGLTLAVPPIKRGSGFIVPLPDVIQDIMDEYLPYRVQVKSDAESLFLNCHGKLLKPKTVRQWVANIGRRAGCSRTVTPHDMRRMCATIHAHFGDLDTLRRILNHKREQTTLEYVATPGAEGLRRILSKLPSVSLVEDRLSR